MKLLAVLLLLAIIFFKYRKCGLATTPNILFFMESSQIFPTFLRIIQNTYLGEQGFVFSILVGLGGCVGKIQSNPSPPENETLEGN